MIVNHRKSWTVRTDFDTELGAPTNGKRATVSHGAFLAIALSILAGVAVGCSGEAKPAAQAPPQVSVAEVVCKQLGDTDEFTGRLEAVTTVEVRPRVSGYLQSVHFQEGAIVRQGQLLFQIDPRPFQAEVDRLRGELAQAKAQLARAQSDFERAERLHNNDGMSAEEYDRREAVRNETEAKIASTEAALRGAELNLEFTRVTAPIMGRVSRAEITAGNLVEAGAAQVKPLTTMVSLDPIYAFFDVDEQTYLKYSRPTQTQSTNSRELGNSVFLGLADETDFPHAGRVNFVDNQVSSSTGTIRVRGTFPNKNLALTPGLFARVKLQGVGKYEGCLAKDEAIVTDLNKKYILALGKNNTVEYRAVKLGPMEDGLRVVREGLQPGDSIVVNGLQRVRPGAVVNPIRTSMAKGAAIDEADKNKTTAVNRERSDEVKAPN
ncbi:MAG TPA: efflux RND transporter periplasmic adaptor subunit [Candidatus Dormibacteraeota bacterium]|nr:efflux RND transporter periplasmic adaptor subunit [Candidatus Dormibacteraeota bacterium]